jgi:hypothetical protein
MAPEPADRTIKAAIAKWLDRITRFEALAVPSHDARFVDRARRNRGIIASD